MKDDNARLISQSTVLDMGFTKSMIEILLPVPVLKPNPRYRSSAPMKLYRIEDVSAAMETEAYRVASEKAEARRSSAEKAVETKRQKGEALIDTIVEELVVERIDIKELERIVLREKEERAAERGDYLHRLDDETVARWMVNYVRHNLCQYDDGLMALVGKVGKDALYVRLKEGTLRKIAQVYPELKDECMRQAANA